jgi:tetratricopeptide (TPR) repeat protein
VIVLVLFSLILPLSVAGADETRALPELEMLAAQYLQGEQFGEFSGLIPEIKASAHRLGIQNLSGLSLVFLEAGAKRCGQDFEACAYFIRGALQLSPSDPNVYVRSAELEPGVSYALTKGAISNLFNSPRLLTRWVTIGALGLLSVLTITFALWALLKICRLERKGMLRGANGPLLFCLFAFIGIPFGLLATVTGWVAIIYLARGNVRRESILFLALILCWVLILPIAETIVLNTRRPSEGAIERALSSVRSFERQVPHHPSDPLALLSEGSSAFFQGRYEEAKSTFEVVGGMSSEKKIRRVALARQGAAELQLRDPLAAERSLKQALSLGGESFEIVQNLALVEAARADLEAQRKYMEQLKSLDDARFRSESMDLLVLLEPLPFSVFWSRYLETPERYSTEPVADPGYLRNISAITPLVTVGGFWGLLGVLSLAVAMSCLPRRRFA